MLDSGAFDGKRFELLDGELIDKMGQKPRHAGGLQRVLDALADIFGIRRVRVQAPVDVAIADRERNFPEPDLAVVRERKPDYEERHPDGDELILAVEVSDTSLRTDAKSKRDLYARAGVPEYWVLDIVNRRLIVHRDPVEGAYRTILTLGENDTVHVQAAPEAQVPIADLLPRPR
jgi:Uma2 family endonuclease